eukprot:959859-Alexandrium_andersonii.AAC.1
MQGNPCAGKLFMLDHHEILEEVRLRMQRAGMSPVCTADVDRPPWPCTQGDQHGVEGSLGPHQEGAGSCVPGPFQLAVTDSSYVDDTAIMLRHADPRTLVTWLLTVLDWLVDAFERRGHSINLGANKTEVLLRLFGHDAAETWRDSVALGEGGVPCLSSPN